MSATFKPIYHECNNVGKRVKSSKKRYQWKFSLENREHTLDLYVSKLSGKRKVMLNGEIKFNGKKQGGILFSYAFKIGRTTVMVFQKEEGYDLRIDHIYFSEKSKTSQGSWGDYEQESAPRQDSWGARRNSDEWNEAPKEDEYRSRAATGFGKNFNEPKVLSNKGKSNKWEADTEDWERYAEPYVPKRDKGPGKVPQRFSMEEEKKPKRPEPKVQYNQRPAMPVRQAPVATKAPPAQDMFDLLDLTASKPAPTPAAALTSLQMSSEPSQHQTAQSSTQLASHWDNPGQQIGGFQAPPQQHFATQDQAPGHQADWQQEAFQAGSQPQPQYSQQVFDSEESSSDEEYAEYDAQPYNPIHADPFGDQSNNQYPPEASQQWGEEAAAQSNNPFGDSVQPPAQNAPQQGFDMFSEPQQPAQVMQELPPSARPLKDDNIVTGLVDLDNLHLGDGYSPMVAQQIAEKNKPVSVKQPAGANIPMNQYNTAAPQMQGNPMMTNPMMGNPMMTNPSNPMMGYNPVMGTDPMMGNNPMMAQQAAAMQQAMMNQFMTNMAMMNQFNNQPK